MTENGNNLSGLSVLVTVFFFSGGSLQLQMEFLFPFVKNILI